MGIKATDLSPLGSYGPTALTPKAKDIQVKVFNILRTDTTASVKAVLPADASILDFVINGVASNAATTATVSIGSTSAANEYVNAQDVKTAGGTIRPTSTVSTNIPNIEPIPNTGDLQIWAKYAETGTASTAGGPYTVMVYYVR
jgi:hypothetical protein